MHYYRGASRLRPYDAAEFKVHPNWGGSDKETPLIATGAVEYARIKADERVGRHRKKQLENGIAGTAACTSDPNENERNRLALCAVGPKPLTGAANGS
jgi:hypothetical protein